MHITLWYILCREAATSRGGTLLFIIPLYILSSRVLSAFLPGRSNLASCTQHPKRRSKVLILDPSVVTGQPRTILAYFAMAFSSSD
jgi:hypothetical protein